MAGPGLSERWMGEPLQMKMPATKRWVQGRLRALASVFSEPSGGPLRSDGTRNIRRSDTNKRAGDLLRDAALLVALGTGFLYLTGATYLEAKYWRLGVTSQELTPSTASALLASFFPLLTPIVLLA